MRIRALLVAVIALLMVASAAAAPRPSAKHVRIVKQHGAFTAVLTYTSHPKDWTSPISDVKLRVERGGHVVFHRKICQPWPRKPYRCDSWGPPAGLFRTRVGPGNTLAFVVNLWTGGNTCCQATYVATLGSRVRWITHTFSFLGASTERMRGHTFFIGSDGRFYCAFSVCAGGTAPIQIWAINSKSRFVDVTRSFPELVRRQARSLATGGGPRMRIRDQGSGVLAAWCGDEYLLGHGARCTHVVKAAMKRHWPKTMQGAIPRRGFLRGLDRDLTRWGYKRR